MSDKKLIILHLIIIALGLSTIAKAKNIQTELMITPYPTEIQQGNGFFTLDSNTKIINNTNDKEYCSLVSEFINDVSLISNIKLEESKRASSNTIKFYQNSTIKEEGYQLAITNDSITISSSTAAGAFYATQTLLQLIVSSTTDKSKSILLSALSINDYPLFKYRGYMLDVARHFFSLDYIKKLIRALSYYKINYLHLHLTDDQGWRCEIEKYPLLNKIGSWRNETQIGHRTDVPLKFDGIKHGGYYKKSELKELVSYASKYNIQIIPEIDIPGHAQAILAAYPQYGCVKDTTYEVSTKWGVHDNILCPKEETFTFIEDILYEISEIFPCKYIHIGGDEVPARRWTESYFCQNLLKEKNMNNINMIHTYFINRITSFAKKIGRKIIGWDEILNSNLDKSAIVMSWRGEKGGIESVHSKHYTIMTPNQYTYLNYYNTNYKKRIEPLANTASLPLKKVYDYNPFSEKISEENYKYIIGIQGALWTEYCKTPENASALSFPRICAIAETGWTSTKNKDYDRFYKSISTNIWLLNFWGINYSSLFYNKNSNNY